MKLDTIDLSELRDRGVLKAANEQFFWPQGLSLAWYEVAGNGPATELHIRQRIDVPVEWKRRP